MTDYQTTNRQNFLKRIQQRIDTDIVIAAVCGTILGAMLALSI